MGEYGGLSPPPNSEEALDSEMRRPRHLWWLYLAGIAPVAVAYLAGPLKAGPVFNLIGFSACVAIVVGVRINRPATRWAWYLIALGQLMLVAGDVIAYNYKAFFGSQLPFPSIADPLYLAVYPLTVAGLLLLLRHRNPGRDWASLVDSLIVTIGLALLSWIFLISPYAHDATLHLGPKLVSIAYPLSDILMLGVAMRMAVGGGRRPPAYYMLIAGICAVVITDSVYGWIQLHGTYQPGDPLDGGWIVYYVLWGAAALHPSMATVSDAAATARAKLTRPRLLGIAAAALIAPVIEMIKEPGGSDSIVVGSATVVLFALVVVRMIGLARELEVTANRERTMRQAAGVLVTATSAAEIMGAAHDAAAMFAGSGAQLTVLEVKERDGHPCLIGPGPRDGDELTLPLASLPPHQLEQLVARTAVDIPRGSFVLGRARSAAPAFAVPIVAQSQLVGVVALLNPTTGSLAMGESLELLAAQVGSALESAALTENVVRGASELRFSALVQHSTDVIFVLAPDTAVEYVSPSIEPILGYRSAELLGGRLADYIPEEDRGLVLPALAGLQSRVSETSEALEFRIRHRDGRLLHAEGQVTNLLDNAAVGGIVVNLRDVTERKQFEQQLTHQAFHDPVTDLANRALFRDRVGHALGRRRDQSQPLAVLFLDLDDFKGVNDTFGHGTGDHLLQTISARIEPALRAGDTLARLGGDEFAILLEDIEREAGISETVERLLEVISTPSSLDGREVSVHCSIGIAVAGSSADEEALITVDELLRNADAAMYQAKSAGGNTYRHFNPEMHAAALEALELRAELKAAIEADELTLAYQPIFDLHTDEVSGYEALLRWEQPRRGTVSPATFIPIAEDSGLIIPLGRWVLERACRDAVRFQQATPGAKPRTVSVNVSAVQMQRVEIVDEVRDALRSSGLPPSRLVLEITESLMIDNVDLAIERLGALRRLGVRIALDDFGTGYSSLDYIRRLPISVLKIDKHFVDSVDGDDKDSEITAAIIELARLIDVDCVAEGVERPEQRERLQQLGCGYGQGFLMARPMSPAALQELFQRPVPTLIGAT
jgi:diguanylate cyclase (GGDEF)-like protein/PAS domain S-box-containing protein